MLADLLVQEVSVLPLYKRQYDQGFYRSHPERG